MGDVWFDEARGQDILMQSSRRIGIVIHPVHDDLFLLRVTQNLLLARCLATGIVAMLHDQSRPITDQLNVYM